MPKVTLTFDNGPEPKITHHVLDILASYNILATFFVVGQKLANPGGWQTLCHAHKAGHWIGNHTYTHHIPLGKIKEPGVAEAEIKKTQALIGPLSHPDKLFRPFGGGGVIGKHLLSRSGYEFLRTGGYTCVLWNSVPRDWEEPHGWVERALQDCITRDWTLLVVHDIDTGAMQHLDEFIQSLLEQNIDIVQNFPPDCVPIQAGKTTLPMAGYINDE